MTGTNSDKNQLLIRINRQSAAIRWLQIRPNRPRIGCSVQNKINLTRSRPFCWDNRSSASRTPQLFSAPRTTQQTALYSCTSRPRVGSQTTYIKKFHNFRRQQINVRWEHKTATPFFSFKKFYNITKRQRRNGGQVVGWWRAKQTTDTENHNFKTLQKHRAP